MDVTAKLEGAKEFANLLRNLPMELEKKAVLSAVRSGSTVVKKAVQRRAPVYQGRGHARGKKTVFPGMLKRSIISRKDPKEKLGMLVGAGRAWYAHLVEWGAKAHQIVPKGLRAIRFPKRMNAAQRSAAHAAMPKALADYTRGVFFGKKVNHPGARKRPFMLPALQESQQALVAAFGRALASSIDREASKWLGKYKVRRR